MRELARSDRLARLARALECKRAPYYVTFPLPPGLRGSFPFEGWYWVPAGGSEAQFLARDSYEAYHRLATLLEARNDDDSDDDEVEP